MRLHKHKPVEVMRGIGAFRKCDVQLEYRFPAILYKCKICGITGQSLDWEKIRELCNMKGETYICWDEKEKKNDKI